MSDYSATFPLQRPVFTQDFAQSGKIDPRATFSRDDSPIDVSKAAASAVHYWSNEKHLSSENLVLQSENYDINPWLRTYDLTPTGSQTAPDGSSNAWLLTPTAGTNPIRIQQAITLEATTAYTASCYMKAGTATHGFMSVRGTSSHYAQVTVDFSDPTNPTSSGVNFTSVSATSTAVGSTGWYRVVLNFTSSSTVTSERIHVSPTDGTGPGASGVVTWTSAGNETMFLWGVQLNTTGATVYDSPTTTQISRSYAPKLKSVSTAGAARFEYDPTDGQSEGILIEGQSTNLLTYSSDLSNGAFNPNNVTVTTEAVSPDGTLSAVAVREDGTTNQHRINQVWAHPGGDYTISVYAKAFGNSRRLLVREGYVTGSYASFDLTTGTVAAESSSGVGKIESVGGSGWYRCSVTSSNAAANLLAMFYLLPSTGTTSSDATYAGDSYSGLLMAMAQAENQFFCSSWISTASSTATRAADQLTITDASIFNGGEHSVYWEGSFNGSIIDPRMFSLSDGTNDNRLVVDYNDGNTPRIRGWADGTLHVSESATGQTLPAGSSKIVGTLKTNESRLAINGTQYAVDTTNIVVGTMDRIAVGSEHTGGNVLNGHVKRVAYYNTALSQTEIETLTAS